MSRKSDVKRSNKHEHVIKFFVHGWSKSMKIENKFIEELVKYKKGY